MIYGNVQNNDQTLKFPKVMNNVCKSIESMISSMPRGEKCTDKSFQCQI